MAISTIKSLIRTVTYTRTPDGFGQFQTVNPFSRILSIQCTSKNDVIIERSDIGSDYAARAMQLVQESITGGNGYKFLGGTEISIREIVWGGVLKALLHKAFRTPERWCLAWQ